MKVLVLVLFLIGHVFAAKINKISSLDLEFSQKQWRLTDSTARAAQVLAIGESAHGVSKYLKARASLIKYLVENHNYRLILLEDGYLGTSEVDKYLKACYQSTDDSHLLDKALKTLYSTYQNKETQELFEWLCSFNKKKPQERIRFHGMDIWESPWEQRNAVAEAVSFLKDKDKDRFEKLMTTAKSSCFAWNLDSWDNATEDEAYQYFLANRRFKPENHNLCLGTMFYLKRILMKYSYDKYPSFRSRIAIRAAEGYEKTINSRDTNAPLAMSHRDEAQAFLVVEWSRKFADKLKTVFLAHNLHISKKQSAIIPMNPGSIFPWRNVVSAGEHLYAHYGMKYKAIAITGYDIESSRDGQYVISDKSDSLDLVLSKKYEAAYLNTNSKLIRKRKKWWMHTENEQMYLSPVEQYDGIIFFKNSRAAEKI